VFKIYVYTECPIILVTMLVCRTKLNREVLYHFAIFAIVNNRLLKIAE